MVRFAQNVRAYVRPMPRLTETAQIAVVGNHAHPDRIYVEGRGPETLEAAIRSLRRGDVLVVKRLHVLAPPKKTTADNPRKALWEAIKAIEKQGASIVELDTGRSTLDDRDDMIADAIEHITRSGRSLTHRQAKARGLKGGRPAKEYNKAEIARAEAAWFNLRFATNREAVAACPGWTEYQMRKHFGPSKRTRY